jgi:hypothetical protein
MSFTRLQPNDRNLLAGLNIKLCALEALLSADSSKMARISGSADYSRVLTYDPTGDQNVITVLHTGTTSNGVETILETISYVDPTINNSQVTSIVYS